ncbi:MAG: trigger factor [Candidatus Omnitrophota bacterium]
MKVVTTKDKNNKVIFDIEVGTDVVKKKFDEVYEKIGQEAKIPGFRAGKVPRHVLEQHHAKLAREEVLKALIAQTYEEAVKSEQIDVIDMPQISEVKLEAEMLSYKAAVEVKPEVKIKQYKGLKLKKNEIKVEPSEVEDYIKQLKKTRQPDIDDERLAKSLGYRTKDELLDCLTKQLFLKKENEERARLERELINQLVKNSTLIVPVSLVSRRIEELRQQARHQMAEYGVAPDKVESRLQELEPKLNVEAEEQVKVFLILEAIAKLENMKSDNNVIALAVEFLFAEAEWM